MLILPLQEQYKNDAKVVYGETEKHKEYEKDYLMNLHLIWKSYLKQTMTYDTEILKCIAIKYKLDKRWKNYFAQLSDEDFSDFVYQAIMYYCNAIGCL
ncbi:hypothetical protein [Clostridium yunnanense]|uniref:hypothetical protein n=1 Tax=Clostridium yunnanense TaxID=2800325 RepID=UPI0019077078|nr:hypothetical protein [Clostridium yunnanense]